MRAPDLRRANWEWELGEEERKKRELGWLAAGLPGWLVSLFYFFFLALQNGFAGERESALRVRKGSCKMELSKFSQLANKEKKG